MIGDLNRRRGTIQDQIERGTNIAVVAVVPLSEMFGYIGQLRSMTSGRASYTMELSHYEGCRRWWRRGNSRGGQGESCGAGVNYCEPGIGAIVQTMAPNGLPPQRTLPPRCARKIPSSENEDERTHDTRGCADNGQCLSNHLRPAERAGQAAHHERSHANAERRADRDSDRYI